jgi:spermidine synthase
MALWIPFYECSPETVKSLIATFFRVFPEGIIWSNDFWGEGYDAVLFGQAGPTRIDIDQVQRRLERPDYLPVKESLGQTGFRDAIDLFGTFAGYAPQLKEWLGSASINSDHNLRLQYLAGMGFNKYISAEILDEIFRYYSYPDSVFQGSELTILDLREMIEYRY